MLAVCICPGIAFATEESLNATKPLVVTQAANLASGTWGTCPWEISADGTLTVHPGTGGSANVPIIPEMAYYGSYWDAYKSDIKRIVFAEEKGKKAIAPANLSWMFSNLPNVESFDLSGLDTSLAADMNRMFIGCKSLKSLDLGSFDTSNVKNMSLMFRGCDSLESIDLLSFDTTELTDCQQMFQSCSSLATLDLSSFDTSNLEDSVMMFTDCTSLKTIYVSDLWTMKSIVNNEHQQLGNSMFTSCVSLVGGNGTAYAFESPSDETYARIDAPGQPGYLTYKAAPAKSIAKATISGIKTKTYTGKPVTHIRSSACQVAIFRQPPVS